MFEHDSDLQLIDFIKVLLGQLQKPTEDQSINANDQPAVEVTQPENLLTSVTRIKIDGNASVRLA